VISSALVNKLSYLFSEVKRSLGPGLLEDARLIKKRFLFKHGWVPSICEELIIRVKMSTA
jgi:hypothetical protein